MVGCSAFGLRALAWRRSSLERKRKVNKPASQFVKIVRHCVFEVNRIEERSLQSKVLATVAAVALAMVLGALDYFTGREWAISAFYLLPTCVAAWMAGRWAGFAVGALCTGAWFVSDMFNGATYQSPLIPVWNAIMLFIFFFVVVWNCSRNDTCRFRTTIRSGHYRSTDANVQWAGSFSPCRRVATIARYHHHRIWRTSNRSSGIATGCLCLSREADRPCRIACRGKACHR